MTIGSSMTSRSLIRSATAVAWAAALLATAANVHAQQPSAHYLYGANLPPGAVALSQLQRGGPLAGYFQPIELYCPDGGEVSLETQGRFVEASARRVRAGMLIGPVYRIKVTNIPDHPGAEVYPTVEVINRIFPPPGQQARFPIPVHLTKEELERAIEGQFVTRVVYLESRETALPLQDDPEFQRYFEVHPQQDPLRVADELGRPLVILRMGSRVPDASGQMGMDYGSPPLIRYELPEKLPQQEGEQPAPAELKGVVPAQDRSPRQTQGPRASAAPQQTSAQFRPRTEGTHAYSTSNEHLRHAAARNVLRFPNGIFRRRGENELRKGLR
jgi:hypothetical protein